MSISIPRLVRLTKIVPVLTSSSSITAVCATERKSAEKVLNDGAVRSMRSKILWSESVPAGWAARTEVSESTSTAWRYMNPSWQDVMKTGLGYGRNVQGLAKAI